MKTGPRCVMLLCGLAASGLGMFALWTDGVSAQQPDTSGAQPPATNAPVTPPPAEPAAENTPAPAAPEQSSAAGNAMATAASIDAQPVAQAKHAGLDSFKANCAGCHSVGGGRLVGPDLKDVLKRVPNREWIHRFVKDPAGTNDAYAKKIKAEFAPMLMTPSKDLSDATIDDIIDFIEAGGPGLQAIKLREMNTTDIPLGRQLFMGEVRLANGGPACISCHTTGDAGFWGGGTLAKDLTKAADRNGGVAGLQAALTSPQFIVMKEIFAKAPLTENEVVALSAYLGDVAKKDEQPVSGFWFIALAVFGAVDLILLSQMVWVKRFDAVRKPLIRETYQGG